MRKFGILLLSFAAVLSCQAEKDASEGKSIRLEFSLSDTKVAFNADRTAFIWDGSDAVTVLNDAGSGSSVCPVDNGQGVVTVPEGASRIYAVYPTVSATAGPTAVPVSIPLTQTQATGGVFPSQNYPLAASGDIVGGRVSLNFKPIGAALALNIYGGTGSIHAVRVTPLANTRFAGSAELDLTAGGTVFSQSMGASSSVTLHLSEPVPVGVSKPATDEAKRTWPGQIYVCLARQAYTALCFEIDTGSTTWKITTSDSFVFDCVGSDIILTNINLEKGVVEVTGVSGESFDAGGTLEKIPGSFSALEMDDDSDDVDRIPDFSRVGYQYGDEPIPTRPVVATIDIASISAALSAGTAVDTTDYIQKVIDQVGASGGGAILFKNGTYNVSRILFLDCDNTVLRGESESGTIIKNNATIQAPIVYVGASLPRQAGETETESITFVSGRRVSIGRLMAKDANGNYRDIVTYSPRFPSKSYGSRSAIIEDYVPLGRLYVEVRNPNLFSPGDPVCIYRQPTQSWLEDIGMTRIANGGRDDIGLPTIQWTVGSYTFRWTRRVIAVRGNRVYLDAPVVQSLETRYGGGELVKYTQTRVKGCGVEIISFDCAYDGAVVVNGNQVDESHAWDAVQIKAAEHCWVRNVTSRHMGYALVDMGNSARCITVDHCTSLSPVSAISGARRYAYCCSEGAELCLVKDCYCEYDRHSFVTNGPALGPNVFVNCRSEHGLAAIGPHWGWATGTLYDCVQADSNFEAQDGGNQGRGHGWRGMCTVFWNISTTAKVVCQSAWGTCPSCGTQWNRTEVCSTCGATLIPSGRNYAVGVQGTKVSRTIDWRQTNTSGVTTNDYFVDMYGYGSHGENRPDGQWYPARAYDSTGGSDVLLPQADPVSWWPRLTLESYSSPRSLYQSQLEDRHARGIYLNNLL